jgi:hypothetical protein
MKKYITISKGKGYGPTVFEVLETIGTGQDAEYLVKSEGGKAFWIEATHTHPFKDKFKK